MTNFARFAVYGMGSIIASFSFLLTLGFSKEAKEFSFFSAKKSITALGETIMDLSPLIMAEGVFFAGFMFQS